MYSPPLDKIGSGRRRGTQLARLAGARRRPAQDADETVLQVMGMGDEVTVATAAGA